MFKLNILSIDDHNPNPDPTSKIEPLSFSNSTICKIESLSGIDHA